MAQNPIKLHGVETPEKAKKQTERLKQTETPN